MADLQQVCDLSTAIADAPILESDEYPLWSAQQVFQTGTATTSIAPTTTATTTTATATTGTAATAAINPRKKKRKALPTGEPSAKLKAHLKHEEQNITSDNKGLFTINDIHFSTFIFIDSNFCKKIVKLYENLTLKLILHYCFRRERT